MQDSEAISPPVIRR